MAKRTILGSDAIAVLLPILEEIAGWKRIQIREFFDACGFTIQEWESVRTDWLTLRPSTTGNPTPQASRPASSSV